MIPPPCCRGTRPTTKLVSTSDDATYFTRNNGTQTTTLVEYDSGGAHYVGQDAEADRAYGPDGQQFAYDVTYLSGVAVEYTNSSATVLGTKIPS